MSQTENIVELVTALSKMQGALKPAKFNKGNPHFKSQYADFTSCMDACRDLLAANNLAIMQYCDTVNEKLVLVTMLAHVSGQWIKSYYPLLPKDFTSQAIGSAMTYAKRYSLSAMLGIVADEERDMDDDGEAADGRGKQSKAALQSPPIVAKAHPDCKAALQATTPPTEKISEKQVAHLKELEKMIDATCKANMDKHMLEILKIRKYDDLNQEQYNTYIQAMQNNINLRKNENNPA